MKNIAQQAYLEAYAKLHKEVDLFYDCDDLLVVEFPKAQKGYGIYNMETLEDLWELYDQVAYEVATLNAKVLNGHKELTETKNMLSVFRNYLWSYVAWK